VLSPMISPDVTASAAEGTPTALVPVSLEPVPIG